MLLQYSARLGLAQGASSVNLLVPATDCSATCAAASLQCRSLRVQLHSVRESASVSATGAAAALAVRTRQVASALRTCAQLCDDTSRAAAGVCKRSAATAGTAASKTTTGTGHRLWQQRQQLATAGMLGAAQEGPGNVCISDDMVHIEDKVIRYGCVASAIVHPRDCMK